jgi:acyl-CoA thioester hydrolase
MHVTYEREVTEGDPLAFTTRILGVDAKRVHLFHTMHHATDGWLAATNELILMHVDLDVRRSCPLPDRAFDALAAIHRTHAALPVPPQVGRLIGLKSRSS